MSWIIKHYWNEKTKSATLEPSWLTSGEKISSEQERIKQLYNQTLGNLNYYNTLSSKKIPHEVIDGFNIEYKYKTKKDPLNPEGNRMVTDIEMIVSKQKSYFKYLILLFVMLVTIIIMYVFTENEEDAVSIKENKKSIQEIHSLAPASNIKNIKKKEIKFNICNYQDLSIKNDDDATKCLKSYLENYCNRKIKYNLNKYLQTKPLKCWAIENLNLKELSLKKYTKKEQCAIKNFLEGKKNESN